MTGFDYSAVKENGPSEVRKFILWVLVAGGDFDSCSILHRCWCWVLHLIHLWLPRVSINDSSDLNRLEAVIPCAPVKMEILAWTSVVYQRHLTSYFTDISCFLALPFQDMVQLCRLHIQQYSCWMDSFFLAECGGRLVEVTQETLTVSPTSLPTMVQSVSNHFSHLSL